MGEKMMKTMLSSICESLATAIIIVTLLRILGFVIVPDDRVNGVVSDSNVKSTEKESSFPHHRWCYESKDLKPDDFCIQGITYREYRASSDDPMMNFRLYGVSLGEESRAAVAKGETRILGGEKVPICRVADKYDTGFCYNDAKMEAHLVAKDHRGQTAIVWPNDYHDTRKGFRFEIIAKTK